MRLAEDFSGSMAGYPKLFYWSTVSPPPDSKVASEGIDSAATKTDNTDSQRKGRQHSDDRHSDIQQNKVELSEAGHSHSKSRSKSHGEPAGDQRMLVLKKNEERRLAAGHLWVYSNEVDKAKSPLKSFTAGEQVPVYSSRGKFIAMACVNSHSLICARVYSYRRSEMINVDLIKARLATALAHREQCYDQPYYRLVHSEGDWIPGLIIDRYGDYLVVQTNTAGMDAERQAVVDALVEFCLLYTSDAADE